MSKRRLCIIAILVGLFGYAAAFYFAPLADLQGPNHQPLRRIDLLLSFRLAEAAKSWFDQPPQFTFADRLPILFAVGLIFIWALVAGRLALTLCRLDRGMTRLEHFIFASAIGFNLLSTWTLFDGWFGTLSRSGTVIMPMAATFLVAALVHLFRAGGENALKRAVARCDREAVNDGDLPVPLLAASGAFYKSRRRPKEVATLGVGWLWLAVPFVAIIVLTAVLPPTDYDVCEYHLQAPKEFFLAHHISFLPHNVYAAMPMGVEMLSLLGMLGVDDWWLGALVGKTLIALFTPLCAAGIFAAGRRLHSMSAGVVGALVYLSTPGVMAVTPAGLVEGPSACYGFLAVYALLLPDVLSHRGDPAKATPSSKLFTYRRFFLAGYLAGAAVAIKYPAVLFVVVPLAAWVFFVGRGTRGEGRGARDFDSNPPPKSRNPQIPKSLIPHFRRLLVFLLAAALACGGWFAKNWATTGNPTYPLLYSVFGGKNWSAEKDRLWNAAHRAHDFSPAALGTSAGRVVLTSEWIGLLLLPLAVLALLRRRTRRLAAVLFCYAAFLFGAWWLLTHRLDRFLLPMSAVLAFVAGLGACWTQRRWWRRGLEWVLLLAAATTLATAASGRGNAWFVPLRQLRASSPDWIDPWHRYFNECAGRSAVLTVGNATVFDLVPTTYYNTCFDTCLLEQWVKGRTPDDIRREFASRGIAFVYVDWEELIQHRKTGYGGEPFVQPAVFAQLVREGILQPLPPLRGRPQEPIPHAFVVMRKPSGRP